MYLCLCYGVTEGVVEQVITQGASSLQEVQKACRAGTDCGSCVCEIRERLLKHRQEAKKALLDSDDPLPAHIGL